MGRGLFVVTTLFLVACTAHFPVNPPLKSYDPDRGYRLKNLGVPGNSEEILVILAFSGGGTRSAALAYGVLEHLAVTNIQIDGHQRRLLDEVDVISAVSGGSFTAAYYGLYGDRIFEDFQSRFLKRDIDKALTLQLFSPANWARLVSASFSRSDMVARYYDKHIFDGGTFADIAARRGPAIIINATDMSLGAQFMFLQYQFDFICSDVSTFSLARAVTASSAVPVVFTPITLRNYAGLCGFRPPYWFVDAFKSPDPSSRRAELADRLFSYLDSTDRPYVHLMDGGLSDNLGVRGPMDRVLLIGNAIQAMRLAGQSNVRKLVFIVVNAESEPDRQWDQHPRAPKMKQVLKSTTSLIVNRSNYETLEVLKRMLEKWRDEVRSARCTMHAGNARVVRVATITDNCSDIDTYLVRVDFDQLHDPKLREYLKQLPTAFSLPPEAVDSLRQAAGMVLNESTPYQRFVKELR
jgi:NTE family protein